MWGSEGIAPLIPHLGARWRGVIGFIPRTLYPGEIPPFPTELEGDWVLRTYQHTVVTVGDRKVTLRLSST